MTIRARAVLRAVSIAGTAVALAVGPGWPAAASGGGPAFTPERAFSRTDDEWEPAVAVDRFGDVYVMTTRYGAPPACPHCPKHSLVFRRSSDGGRTFGPVRQLCACPGFGGQNDPVMATDDAGRLYVAWLNNYHVFFARSDDFGRTWAVRHRLDRDLKWSDKPWLAVSPDGRDVYVVLNGSPRGRPYGVASQDGGRTFGHPVPFAHGHRYWFAGGAAVLPDGTVLSSQAADFQVYRGHDVRLYVVRSEDGGGSWSRVLVGTSAGPKRCPIGSGCGFGYFGAQAALAADGAGGAYVVFGSSRRNGGPARLLLRRSDDGGQTWSPPIEVVHAPGVDHEFPMVAATGRGDVRVAWMDDRTGRWNVFFRRSRDGGRTWGPVVRLSRRSAARPYQSLAGFVFPYGDYGQMAIDGRGRTHVVWGEGPSYVGPGSTWYARGRSR